MKTTKVVSALVAGLLLLVGAEAQAEEEGSTRKGKEGNAYTSLSRLGQTESPFGMGLWKGFVALSGKGTSARSENKSEGGLRVGLSPLPRLTLHGFVGRDSKGKAAPSAAVHVRLVGDQQGGAALGLLGQYKTEGFSELGGELETGLTFGVSKGRWVAMGNAVVGVGVEEKEKGELDGELKMRGGYNVAEQVWIGVEGEVRRRFAGPNRLAGGRDWDGLVGPQLAWAGAPAVVALSVGPSTQGIRQGVGLFAELSVSAAFGK